MKFEALRLPSSSGVTKVGKNVVEGPYFTRILITIKHYQEFNDNTMRNVLFG